MITEVKIFIQKLENKIKLGQMKLEFSNGQAKYSNEFEDLEFEHEECNSHYEKIKNHIASALNISDYIILIEGADF